MNDPNYTVMHTDSVKSIKLNENVNSNSLVRFQKALNDNANGGPPDNYHNLFLQQFQL